MKKLWIFLLVATLCLTVVACANDGDTDTSNTDDVTTAVTDAPPEETDPTGETDPPADTKEVDPADVWKDIWTNAVQETDEDEFVFPNN